MFRNLFFHLIGNIEPFLHVGFLMCIANWDPKRFPSADPTLHRKRQAQELKSPNDRAGLRANLSSLRMVEPRCVHTEEGASEFLA